MAKLVSAVDLTKESLSYLYKYIPTRLLNMWDGSGMKEIMNSVSETSSEVLFIAKYLASHPKIALDDLLLLVPTDRREVLHEAASNHTFSTKVDRLNGILRFERNQSDFLPPIRMQNNREAMLLLMADVIVEGVIFALNLVGYPVPSAKHIKETILKVTKILQDDETFSFVSRLLKKGEPDRSVLSITLVVNLLKMLYKKGHLQDIVRELLNARNSIDIIKAIAKVTVLVVAVADHFVLNENIKTLLKGSALLSKIPILWELGANFKSKL